MPQARRPRGRKRLTSALVLLALLELAAALFVLWEWSGR
jgi:hypothetical protein